MSKSLLQRSLGQAIPFLISPHPIHISRMTELVFHRFLTPWLHSDFIYKRTAVGKHHQKQLEILHGFTSTVIEEKRIARQSIGKAKLNVPMPQDNDIGKKKRLALLDLLLDSMEDSDVLTYNDLRQEVDTFMFAVGV